MDVINRVRRSGNLMQTLLNRPHYLCFGLCKKWSVHCHVCIVFLPEQPTAMFSFNHCVISHLGNKTNISRFYWHLTRFNNSWRVQKMVIIECKLIYIHFSDLTRNSCKKCNLRNRTCGPAIPVQRSNHAAIGWLGEKCVTMNRAAVNIQ